MMRYNVNGAAFSLALLILLSSLSSPAQSAPLPLEDLVTGQCSTFCLAHPVLSDKDCTNLCIGHKRKLKRQQ